MVKRPRPIGFVHTVIYNKDNLKSQLEEAGCVTDDIKIEMSEGRTSASSYKLDRPHMTEWCGVQFEIINRATQGECHVA